MVTVILESRRENVYTVYFVFSSNSSDEGGGESVMDALKAEIERKRKQVQSVEVEGVSCFSSLLIFPFEMRFIPLKSCVVHVIVCCADSREQVLQTRRSRRSATGAVLDQVL
jgi:hypothetical protein